MWGSHILLERRVDVYFHLQPWWQDGASLVSRPRLREPCSRDDSISARFPVAPASPAPDSVSLPGLSTAPSRSAESVHGERPSRVTRSGDNTCHTSGQRGSLQVEWSPRKDEGPTGLQPRGARRSQGRSPGHTPGRLAGLLALDPHGDCCPHGGLVPRKALPRIWSKLKKLLHLQTRDI